MIIRAGLLIAFTVITMACSDENSFKGNGSTREAAEQSQDSDQAQNYSPNGEPLILQLRLNAKTAIPPYKLNYYLSLFHLLDHRRLHTR